MSKPLNGVAHEVKRHFKKLFLCLLFDDFCSDHKANNNDENDTDNSDNDDDDDI